MTKQRTPSPSKGDDRGRLSESPPLPSRGYRGRLGGRGASALFVLAAHQSPSFYSPSCINHTPPSIASSLCAHVPRSTHGPLRSWFQSRDRRGSFSETQEAPPLPPLCVLNSELPVLSSLEVKVPLFLPRFKASSANTAVDDRRPVTAVAVLWRRRPAEFFY